MNFVVQMVSQYNLVWLSARGLTLASKSLLG